MSVDEIVRIAGNGEGVTADGRHAPLAAPGDNLDGFGVLTPGPHHQMPPCRHFPKCGGCQIQHVDDTGIQTFIVDRIAGALASQQIDRPEMSVPALSPPRSRRRASLKAERFGKQVLIGFNEHETHTIVDMHECHVLAPELFALVAPLRGLMSLLLPPRKGKAEIWMTLADQGVDLLIEKVTVEGLAATEALTIFAQEHKLARLSVDEGHGAEPRWEPRPATVTFDGIAVPLPTAGFLQATADGEAMLVETVRAAVGDATTVADLFAGIGTFAVPLAANAKVYAAEGARASATALKAAAGMRQLPLFVEHRDLVRRPLTVTELDRFDAVVLDPPRAGAREQMTALAAASRVRRLAYVSCNPATFARDAKDLIAGGWVLERVVPVGQFRWSTHVELVGVFGRAAGHVPLQTGVQLDVRGWVKPA
ncbi:class I SAM-dependent RNA methyltransferase [Sphingomonas prati]|uniref:23S rRNA (Uracil1939-C5)-methyltransferase n=1 Tax=Sphingomonas prati TaxID=1843237 RepID=A0A7W9BRA9_9SPHN|nr:class I SAM-dependent RNA methyltransferase [Sphingomonas prati]MBB5728183.1 23S rRNA (uracil1939-C5)-methyltransferase [Sphingomonas prati]GGE75744.1 RNA methyltransferase [Sphingomonas prati]